MESPPCTISCPDLLVVLREAPVLVTPAADTPSRNLSIPVVEIFSGIGSILSSHILLFEAQDERLRKMNVGGQNQSSPAVAIRRSLEKLLVPYYPLAGRLRAAPQHGKLQLICNSEGAVFVEACANVSLAHLKKLDKSYWSEFQCQVSVEKSVDVPPLIVQVTMLACGGFVLSIKLLQSLCDDLGVLHFFRGWSELVRGDQKVSTLPIWDPLLPSLPPSARRLHFPSLQLVHGDHQAGTMGVHRQEQQLQNLIPITQIAISFDEINALSRLLKKEGIRHCNTFELLAAHLWRERTRALGIPSSDHVSLFFPSPDLPTLFYGQYAFNCHANTTASDLLQRSLAQVVQLIQEASQSAKQNLPTCMAQFTRLHCPASGFAPPATFIVTLFEEEVSDVDFGWGKPPQTTDAVRIPSPVNAASITAGSATSSLRVLVSNIPTSLVDKMMRHIHDIPSVKDSRL